MPTASARSTRDCARNGGRVSRTRRRCTRVTPSRRPPGRACQRGRLASRRGLHRHRRTPMVRRSHQVRGLADGWSGGFLLGGVHVCFLHSAGKPPKIKQRRGIFSAVRRRSCGIRVACDCMESDRISMASLKLSDPVHVDRTRIKARASALSFSFSAPTLRADWFGRASPTLPRMACPRRRVFRISLFSCDQRLIGQVPIGVGQKIIDPIALAAVSPGGGAGAASSGSAAA